MLLNISTKRSQTIFPEKHKNYAHKISYAKIPGELYALKHPKKQCFST